MEGFLFFCLVLSKLLLNISVRVLRAKELNVLNTVYTRVVRRTRRQAGMPSLDCFILQRRLIYLARLVNTKCSPLLALLSQTAGKNHSVGFLAWLAAVWNDLQRCHQLSHVASSALLPRLDHSAVV